MIWTHFFFHFRKNHPTSQWKPISSLNGKLQYMVASKSMQRGNLFLLKKIWIQIIKRNFVGNCFFETFYALHLWLILFRWCNPIKVIPIELARCTTLNSKTNVALIIIMRTRCCRDDNIIYILMNVFGELYFDDIILYNSLCC